MSEGKWLYHISPDMNIKSIMAKGVHPAFSRGKRKVTWWVELELLDWALAHISARWHVPVDHLAVFASIQDLRIMRKWSKPGVYTCDKPVFAKDFRSALDVMDGALDAQSEETE